MNKKDSRKRNPGERMETTERTGKERGVGMVGLLISASTLAATVVAVWPWTSSPKLPPTAGD